MNEQKTKELLNESAKLMPRQFQFLNECNYVFTKYNISKQEYFYIASLDKCPSSMREISSKHGISPQQLSRLSNSLEAKGLITRKINKENHRMLQSEITDAGLELLNSIKKELIANVENKFSLLSSSELDECITALKKINKIFSKIS